MSGCYFGKRGVLQLNQNRLPEEISNLDLILNRLTVVAEAQPDATALESPGDTKITYRELEILTNQFAHFLIGRKVNPRSVVGICLDFSVEMVVAILGVLKAGASYAFIHPWYPEASIRGIKEQAKLSVIISHKRFAVPIWKEFARVIGLDEELNTIRGLDKRRPEDTIYGETPACILYTLGADRIPRGMLLTHYALARYCHAIAREFGLSKDDSILQIVDDSKYEAGLKFIFPAIAMGATVVLNQNAPAKLVDLDNQMRACKVTLVDLPAQYGAYLAKEFLSRNHKLNPGSTRLMVISGGFVSSEHAGLWRQVLPEAVRLAYTHLCAELPLITTVFEITCQWQETNHLRKTPLGKPVSGNRIYLLDNYKRPLPFGIPGELYIESPYLPSGYPEGKELPRQHLVENPFYQATGISKTLYQTGVLVRYLPNKSVEFIGPQNRQIVANGHYLNLSDIELELYALNGVAGVVVAPQETDLTENFNLLVFINAKNHSGLSPAKLRESLKKVLPVGGIDLKFIPVDTLPTLWDGRVDFETISAVNTEAAQLKEYSDFSGDPVTESLLQIWSRILNIRQLGMDDNFFEMGGSSFHAMELVGKINEDFGILMNLRNLIDNPTVKNMALTIKQLIKNKKDGSNPDQQLLTIISDPGKRYEPFPLTEVQQAYWLGRSDNFMLGNVATHSYFEFQSDRLDIKRLTHAWRALIERHDMLRAIITPDGMQKVLEKVPPYQIKVYDFQEMSAEKVEKQINAIRERMSHQVLPTDQWPLFEICAATGDKNTVRLLVSIDALIMDTWSFQIILDELSQLYFDAGKALPPLEISFRDYIMAQQKLGVTEFYKKSLHYWSQRIPDLPAAPKLPLAKNPACLQAPRFNRYSSRLEQGQWEILKKRAKREGLTPSGLLLAVFADVLRIWSNSENFTINLTLFNPLFNHPQVEQIVGDFTSLTLLEIKSASTESTFKTRASDIQKQLWEDLDNRYVSGVRVLRKTAMTTGNISNLMPVVFTSALINNSHTQSSNDSLESLGEVVYSITQTPQVWLDHEVYEEKQALLFNWDVVEELFPQNFIKEMFAVYCSYLQQLTGDEDAWNKKWLESAQQLIPSGQLQLIEKINMNYAPAPEGLLHSGFMKQALLNPGNIAVESAEKTLTYRELYQIAVVTAKKLRELGVLPGELVGVGMEKSWGQVAAVLGVLISGAAYLPVDIHYPQKRINYILSFSDVKIVITNTRSREKFNDIPNIQTICIHDMVGLEEPNEWLESVQSQQELAYVIFTSGSTGLPKGVMINHLGALNTIEDINKRFRVGPQDRILALSALNFDLSVYDIFGTLSAGGTIVIPDVETLNDPAYWAELTMKAKVTIWNSVPALMGLLVDYVEGRRDKISNSLRLVMLSGDWIPVNLPDRLQQIYEKVKVVSLGGATEGSIWSIIYEIERVEPEWKSIPYGKPMNNQKFLVFGPTMTACPLWVTGQLYIGGIGLAMGYWKDKEKTDAGFIQHPVTGERLYKTGDLGRLLPDGNIEFLGREDFQVKINGYRIELSEIENALAQHPSIHSTVVTTAPNLNHNKYLIAYIVLNKGYQIVPDELKVFLAQRIPQYMIPSVFITLESIPVTTNGKVNRNALPAPTNVAHSVVINQEDQPAIFEQITQIINEVLTIPMLSKDDNLLELGANSVDIIRIANQLERKLGIRPSIMEFYQNPTVASIYKFYSHRIMSKTRDLIINSATSPKNSPRRESYHLILDPVERDEFRNRQPNIRYKEIANGWIPLADSQTGARTELNYGQRRSWRRFLNEAITFEAFSRLLSCLKQFHADGKPKYYYASAGGLYPVQVYLYVKPGRIVEIEGGAYYYNPDSHSVIKLSPWADISRSIDDPFVNSHIYEQAGFAIFLVSQLSAIAPMYGERSLHYSTIEAGLMSQMIEILAPSCGIGLCQIGDLDFNSIKYLFDLSDDHIHLHTFFGGKIELEKANNKRFDETIDDQDIITREDEEIEI
jgi:amino acid adenylation domain-containing protein